MCECVCVFACVFMYECVCLCVCTGNYGPKTTPNALISDMCPYVSLVVESYTQRH